jgi:hypothetical protein
MVLKSIFTACLVFTASLGLALPAWNSAASADEYRPDDFLKLDLPQAVLSPKPLGPPARFEPVPVEAKADPTLTTPKTRVARTAPAQVAKTAPAHVAGTARAHVAMAAPARPAKPHITVPTRLAHRHGNPLDAQALDTRIQVWPCRSGGICNWRR